MRVEYNPTLHKQIISFETFVPRSIEEGGNRVIGYSHTITSRDYNTFHRGDRISEECAVQLLRDDCRRVANYLDANHDWWRDLSTERQAAFLHFAFATGINPRTGFTVECFPLALRALRNGDFLSACNLIESSKWSEQNPKRSLCIRAQLQSGEWV